MKLEQLELLGKLMRADKDSTAFKAAKLVIIDGKTQAEAARELNAKRNAIHNGVQRYKKAHEEVERVYQNCSDT